MGKHRGTRVKSRRSRKRRGGRLASTLAKAMVPFGLLMTQKRMQRRNRRRGSKSRKRR